MSSGNQLPLGAWTIEEEKVLAAEIKSLHVTADQRERSYLISTTLEATMILASCAVWTAHTEYLVLSDLARVALPFILNLEQLASGYFRP